MDSRISTLQGYSPFRNLTLFFVVFKYYIVFIILLQFPFAMSFLTLSYSCKFIDPCSQFNLGFLVYEFNKFIILCSFFHILYHFKHFYIVSKLVFSFVTDL